jgi:LysM repeat protein
MVRLGLLAAAGLLLGASGATDTVEYVVQPGETLWSIAAKRSVLGDPYLWPVIYKFNRDQIKDPARIYPRQRLQIPVSLDPEARDLARTEAGAMPAVSGGPGSEVPAAADSGR